MGSGRRRRHRLRPDRRRRACRGPVPRRHPRRGPEVLHRPVRRPGVRGGPPRDSASARACSAQTRPPSRSRPSAPRSSDANAVGDLVGPGRPTGRARARHRGAAREPQGRACGPDRGVARARRSASSPRPSGWPRAPTGATAPTGSASCSTPGRRCRAWTGPPTTPCGGGSRPRARRTPGTARRTSPSSRRSARVPVGSRSGWSCRPRSWPTPPTGAPPPVPTAT